MSLRGTIDAFDEISRVFDETRDPIRPSTIGRIATLLDKWGVRTILEAGVGTGRVSLPLRAAGLEVTGIDASRGMLHKAREKSLDRLVRGDAHRLPFRARAFDAVLFAHVLHLLDDPPRALREACRVSRGGAIALVEPPTATGGERFEDLRGNPRQRVYELLRAEGVPVPPHAGGPRIRDRHLLEQYPPDHLEVVDDEEVTERLTDDLHALERRGSRWTLHVPEDVLARAIAQARAEFGDRTVTYRRVEALVRWERSPSVAGGAAP